MNNSITTANQPAILGLAFRPFFLLSACFSALAVPLWILLLSGKLSFSPYGNPLFWHAHEMLFGFGAAVLSGFLLTAVQNWTSLPGLSGKPLGLLVLLWLCARLLMIWPVIPPLCIAIIDTSFFLVVAYLFSQPLIKTRNYRNLILVVVLIFMASANGISHLGPITQEWRLSKQGMQLFIWLIVLVMTIIAGRVVPMFTANGTGTKRCTVLPQLEMSCIIISILLVITQGGGLAHALPEAVNIVLLLTAAALHFVRFIRWRFWITLKTPLLWSIHLSYLFIPIGLAAIAGSYFIESLTAVTAEHWLLAGAMANMMLAMMARVSLGHTGRPLISHNIMSLAFSALALAGVIRSLGAWIFQEYYLNSLLLTAILWCAAFSLFLICYWPILTKARVDGKTG